MVFRVSLVLVDANHPAAVLWVRQKRLRHRGRAGGHLLGPSRIWRWYSVDRCVIRPELVIKRVTHGEQAGIERVRGIVTRVKMGALVPHVSRTHIKIICKLVLDGQIPLLTIGYMISIE